MECAPKHSIIKVATFSALMESWARGELLDRQRCWRGSHDPELQERIQMSSCFDNYDDLELDPTFPVFNPEITRAPGEVKYYLILSRVGPHRK